MPIVHSVCPKDCYDTCSLLTHVEEEKVVNSPDIVFWKEACPLRSGPGRR